MELIMQISQLTEERIERNEIIKWKKYSTGPSLDLLKYTHLVSAENIKMEPPNCSKETIHKVFWLNSKYETVI